MNVVRVTVWNECWHEYNTEIVAKIYPDGLHGAIANALRPDAGLDVRTATLRDPECGLSDEVLNNTDVLVWWGHLRHHEVPDEAAAKVLERVWNGMGFVALHSAHYSKPFRGLMGTQCGLKWRVDNKKETLWVVDPSHPIAAGLGEKIELPRTEMYGEWFQIPAPDELVFISWFEGGEVFRSGCCWKRGKGRVFYFRPGHETLPIYHNPEVQSVLRNGIYWAGG